jgi:hypothetical protein
MKVDVEEAVEIGVAMGVGVVAVAVAVADLTENQITMKRPSLAMVFLEDPDHLKMERLGELLRGVAMVPLVVVSAVVAVVVIAMGKLEKVNALEGSMIATAVPVVG